VDRLQNGVPRGAEPADVSTVETECTVADLSKEGLIGTIVLVLTGGVYATTNILHIPEGSREILGLSNSGLRLGTYSAGILMICTADLPLVSGLYEWDGTAWRDAPNAVTNLIQRSRAHSAPTPPGQVRPDGNLAIGPEVPIGSTGLVMQEIVPPGAVTRADIQKVFDEKVRAAPVRVPPTEAEVTGGVASDFETLRRRDAAFAKVVGDMQSAVADKQRLVNTILFPTDGVAVVFSGTTYRFDAAVNYWQSTVAGHAGIIRDRLWRWYEENNEAVQLAERAGESDE
jgi:hypothetical protein